MDRQRKICIWYEPRKRGSTRQRDQAAYCWSCPCSIDGRRGKGRGRNTFNRFSDWGYAGRGAPSRHYVHPWQRCMNAAALHIWRYHREDQLRAGEGDGSVHAAD